MKKRVLVVGAGFFGLTLAERIANVLGIDVELIDRRSHLGGNAHSFIDPASRIEVHKYGIHIFHTSNKKVWEYVNNFAQFNQYRHHVYTVHAGEIFPMPISLATISQFFRKFLTPDEARQIVGRNPVEAAKAKNLRDKAVASVGVELYEAFIRGYTEKQWQLDPAKLPPETIARLPVRFNLDTSYFDDEFQGQPLNGFFDWHARMVENPRVKVRLEVDYFKTVEKFPNYDLVVFTGPIDEFFGYRFGQLNWRTLDLEHSREAISDFQGCAQMNYADTDVPWTRILEYKHLHPEREYPKDITFVTKEFSRRAEIGDEVYYPVNSPEDRARLELYRHEAGKVSNVLFGGRLGTYKYLDMHMAIGSALTMFENEVLPRLRG